MEHDEFDYATIIPLMGQIAIARQESDSYQGSCLKAPLLIVLTLKRAVYLSIRGFFFNSPVVGSLCKYNSFRNQHYDDADDAYVLQ